jgi:hypothetical protein
MESFCFLKMGSPGYSGNYRLSVPGDYPGPYSRSVKGRTGPVEQEEGVMSHQEFAMRQVTNAYSFSLSLINQENKNAQTREYKCSTHASSSSVLLTWWQ